MPAARKRSALPVTVVSVDDQEFRMFAAQCACASLPVTCQRRAFW
jgi:hypothetical protein